MCKTITNEQINSNVIVILSGNIFHKLEYFRFKKKNVYKFFVITKILHTKIGVVHKTALPFFSRKKYKKFNKNANMDAFIRIWKK